MNSFAVIMAGGVGSRFWPVSTSDNPKQFHDMLGAGSTLIQKTYQRLSRFIPESNIFVLTNDRYTSLVLEQIPGLTREQIIPEPAMRNTAPCILLAALKISKIDPNATLLVAPSDHWIEDEAIFEANIKQCFEFSLAHDSLLTLGIKPTFPNTGYGYIEFDSTVYNGLHKVQQFREKPTYEVAKQFLEQGNFLWNAGIFVWSIQSLLNGFKQYQPAMFDLFHNGIEVYNTDEEQQFVEANYPLAENISIDYALLEKANNVYVLPAEFDWNDLGTWGSLHEKLDKDSSSNSVVNAKVHLENTSDCIISTSPGKKVIVHGISDYIIVDKDDVLLIFPKSMEQDIKRITQLAADL
ncbi:MAG: mannose-1-phosphate guanylyltransferase [Flavobacterium sp. BFFFF2]|nr:MAG: mannose-1-phosphate guanylyltransferase [Flavobacterium sp. BFFFF2]